MHPELSWALLGDKIALVFGFSGFLTNKSHRITPDFPAIKGGIFRSISH
jgi:hypothetical protein